ncbi:MAG: hypothetical protein WKF80_07615 [Thermomicrobiales bacterium]
MTFVEIVEEALCFGWVDSLLRALDEGRTMLLITPRTPGSGWSAIDEGRVERLVAAGRMAPAGLAKIEAAKADGSWAVLDASEALQMPGDVTRAPGQDRAADEGFAAFGPSVKKPLPASVAGAKRPEPGHAAASDRLRCCPWMTSQFQSPARGPRRRVSPRTPPETTRPWPP